MSQRNMFYRVKFVEKGESTPLEVVVSKVGSSEFFGLVTLEGFVFSDRKKFVILPNEDLVRKRFSKTERLHIPYHNLLYVEEFFEEPTDLKNIPFIKEVNSSEQEGGADEVQD